jgi:hypothetical protein
MRRFIARLSPLAALTICLPAHAIIRYADGDPNSHTTAPTGTFANAGWQYEGKFGDPANEGNAYLATAIGPHTFITAAHVAGYLGTGITLNGTTYPISTVQTLPARDLSIATVGGAPLTSWAPIYNESADGALVGKTAFMVGRGTQRADAINVTTARATEGTLRGWNWFPGFDNVQRWGTNVVTGFDIDDSPPTPNNNKEYVTLNFDANGLPDEGVLSNKDSGGGMFVQSSSGAWKLSGIASGVDAAYRFTADGPTFSGAIFDFRDLYIEATDHTWHLAQDFQGNSTLTPIPAKSYFSNVTDVPADLLAQYIPRAGDANADGTVNSVDFNILSSHFGMASGATWFDGDFNADGIVNALDFNALAGNFNTTYTLVGATGQNVSLGSSVPEPGAISLIALTTIALLSRRLRLSAPH